MSRQLFKTVIQQRRVLLRKHIETSCALLSVEGREVRSSENLADRWSALGAAAMLIGAATIYNSETTCHCEAGKSKPATTPESELRTCGRWCSNANGSTPCRIDSTLLPCSGKHCQTTAGYWSSFALEPQATERSTSRACRLQGRAYPIGTSPREGTYLMDDVNLEHHLEPTGLEVSCPPWKNPLERNPRSEAAVFGTLECPCNWFGSKCRNEWVAVQKVTNLESTPQALKTVTLHMDVDEWRTVTRNFRPGSLVRVQRLLNGIVYELACAVAYCETPGELEVVVPPPERNQRQEGRKVTEVLRSDHAEEELGTLYVNPIISGFYNDQYEYLLDAIEEQQLEEVVLLSTGAGIGAMLPTIEALIEWNRAHKKNPIKIRFYQGVRNLELLPYKERIESLLQTGQLEMILVQSRGRRNGESVDDVLKRKEVLPRLNAALERGEDVQRQINAERRQHRVYVQDAFQHDLATSDTDKMAVVVCGRTSVTTTVRSLLLRKVESKEKNWIKKRVFLNT